MKKKQREKIYYDSQPYNNRNYNKQQQQLFDLNKHSN